MKNLAIIPARGGSKRIPRKNIKDFLGKPIISYTIETALKSNLFDEVMVSTDDKEIANIAKEYGAKVPFMRTAENADDYATTVDVLLEVIEDYHAMDKIVDNICCMYPAAAFVTTQDLQAGWELLETANSVLPVVEFEFPICRALQKKEDDSIGYVWSENENTRSQDLDKRYHDAGQWYWVQTEVFLQEKTLITSRSKALIKSVIAVQDIDTEQDWKLAEMKYQVTCE